MVINIMYSFNKFSFFVLVGCLSLSAHAVTTIKFATLAPDGTSWMKEMRAGAEAIKQRTQGRVEIKWYPGGVMGDSATVLRKIKIGQLHGGAFTGGELSETNPNAQIYSLPFLFRSLDEVDAVRAKLDPQLKASFEPHGFVVLGLSGGGFAYLMSTHEIRSRDNLKSAKVWVPIGDTLAEEAFKNSGVTPVPLTLADVYTSLQTGLIDTAANTPSGAIAFQWHTKMKYLVNVPLTYVLGILTVDKKVFETLDVNDRQIVQEALGNAFANLEKTSRDDNIKAMETLKDQGITVYEPTAEQRNEWRAERENGSKKLESENHLMPAIYEELNTMLIQIRNAKGT